MTAAAAAPHDGIGRKGGRVQDRIASPAVAQPDTNSDGWFILLVHRSFVKFLRAVFDVKFVSKVRALLSAPAVPC